MKTTRFLFCIFLNIYLFGQESNHIHQQTTPPTNARFEIIQSTLLVKDTFRLDRFTGRTWILVKTKSDDNAWESISILGLSMITKPTRARFQLFTSGIAARHTFLVDTDTGKTWVITISKGTNEDGTKYEENLWLPFDE